MTLPKNKGTREYDKFVEDTAGSVAVRVVSSEAAGFESDVDITKIGGVAVVADDAAFTPGTSTGIVAMGFADETAPDSVGEGDVGALRMTLDRRLKVTNGALEGDGEPVVDSYVGLAISAVTGANQVVVAAPGASKQIWVYGYSLTADTDATTVAFQDEDDVAHDSYTEGFAQYGGITRNPSGNFSMPLFKVATNKALEVDVVTGTIGGSLQYGIISV